jgi:trimeric autotransporter adhesin
VAEGRAAGPDHLSGATREKSVVSKRRVGAVGLALGLGLGAVGSVPASASEGLPVLGGLLGGADGGLLNGLVGSLLHGEGGIFGHEGGVLAGDDQLSDVVEGFGSEDDGFIGGGMEVVGAVQDVLGDANIGGEGSFGGGSGVGGVLGGLLSNGTGLLGGVL